MSCRTSRKGLIVGSLLCAACVTPAAAKSGCKSVGQVRHRIAVEYLDSGINVGGSAHAGQVVASGSGVRSGADVVMQCWKGFITFDHEWMPVSAGEVRPLTIQGLPSGLGLKLTIMRNGAEHFRFASATHWNIDSDWWVPQGTPVDVKDESAYYEIVRTSGPLRFGRVDGGIVARSFGTNSKGGGRLHYEDIELANIAIHRPQCSIVAEDANQTVRLGDYKVTDFGGPEKATPWVPFHFRVAGCPDPAGLIARFTFGVPGDAAPGHPQWFSVPTGPANVALQLGTSHHGNIAPAAPVSLAALGQGERYTFHARLKQSGSGVRGGRFSRAIRLMVEYL